MKPLCIDLFCGLGGWSAGFIAEGYDCIGFDIECHAYPTREFTHPDESMKLMSGKDKHGNTLMNRALEQVQGFHTAKLTGGVDCYPGQLVLQDVLTLHGSQFRNADCIVASPPCQNYSYMAMPWSRAKAMRDRWIKDGPDNRLFDACFRIQREACEAAGRHIPMVVENVKGAQPWVGRAAWSYGSFYLWGDVPALMPSAKQIKNNGGSWFAIGSPGQKVTGQNPDGRKVPGFNFHQHETNGKGGSFQTAAVKIRSVYGDKRDDEGNVSARSSDSASGGIHDDKRAAAATGVLSGVGDTFGWSKDTPLRNNNSHSSARKAASAQIAKIPFALSQWIARTYYPAEKLQEAM